MQPFSGGLGGALRSTDDVSRTLLIIILAAARCRSKCNGLLGKREKVDLKMGVFSAIWVSLGLIYLSGC